MSFFSDCDPYDRDRDRGRTRNAWRRGLGLRGPVRTVETFGRWTNYPVDSIQVAGIGRADLPLGNAS